MSFPAEALWKLLIDAQLVGPDDARQYHAAWVQQNPNGDAQQLAEWLVASNLISRYQASILLAGRPGPFVYGDYRIYDRIEKGRLAGIFRAVHIPTMHRVCLQFLSGEQAAAPELVHYLAHQAAIVSRTSAGFPHLLRCYHLVDLGAFKFFVLEDLQGKRVERILSQSGPMVPHEACRIARQAALGLGRLHAMHQTHGDLRPENIWVDSSGLIKLLQFPLSRNPLAPPNDWRKLAAEEGKEIPVEADYVAPELIAGDRLPDPRSDIYQLGCSLYQMLTNRVPFAGKTVREKLEAHLKGTYVPIEKLNPSIPTDLAKLVGYLMQRKPDLRYQQVSSVIEKLLPFLSPAEARSEPKPQTAIEHAYEGYVQQYLSAAAHAAPVAAAAVPSVGVPSGVAAAAAAAPAASYAAAPVQASPAVAAPAHARPPAMSSAPSAAGPPGPAIRGASVSFAERARRRRAQSVRNLIALVIVFAALAGGGYFFIPWDTLIANRDDQPKVAPTATATAAPTPTATATPTAAATGTAVAGTFVPARDAMASTGDPIFESPTAGKPLDLSYLVPGASMIVALRPSELVAHPEAERLFDPKVLGGAGTWMTTTLPTLAGTGNENIEQVVVAMLDGTDAVRPAYVIRTKEPVDKAALVKSWGDPAPTQNGDVEVFAKDGTQYYVPPEKEGKIVVIAPAAEMTEVIKLKGQFPGMARRELDVLAQSTDGDRHFTLLYAPYFLDAGGRSLTSGPAVRGMTPWNWFTTGFGLPPLTDAGAVDWSVPPASPTNPDDAQPPKAILASGHLGETFFWELRLYNPSATAVSDIVAAPLLERVKEVPPRIENYVMHLASSEYSRAVMYKLPGMMKFAAKEVRAASADKQLVLRGYLPSAAAHNLILAANLCLLEGSGGVQVAAVNPMTGAPMTPMPMSKPKPANATEALQYKMSLQFDRNALDFTMGMISEEIGIPIEIIGPDLQLEGITKNQSFGLAEPEQTVDELLRKIFAKANPDGKLVYQVKPKAPGGPDMIFVTTRAAAEKRKEKLPDVFATPKK